MSDGDLARDQLPRPPLPDADGTVRDLYVEFAGLGPAGPGFYRMDLAELLEYGTSKFWPRLVWDGADWVPPDAAWLDAHLEVTLGDRRYWGLEP